MVVLTFYQIFSHSSVYLICTKQHLYQQLPLCEILGHPRTLEIGFLSVPRNSMRKHL